MNIKTPIDSTTAAEIKLQEILTVSRESLPDSINFRKWFLQQFIQSGQSSETYCPLENFAIYFCNAIRQKAYVHLRVNDGIESSYSKNDEIKTLWTPTKGIKTEVSRSNKKIVLTGQFPALGTTNSRNGTPVIPRNTSTPTRRSVNHHYNHHHHHHEQQNQPQQKHLQITGPQSSRRSTESGHKHFLTTPNSSFEKSRNSTGDGSLGSNSLCLGDFLTSPTITNRHSNAQKKKIQTNTTSTPTNNSNNSSSKPKKRVVPISVSKITETTVEHSGPFGANSSFSLENNILVLSQTEVKDFNKRTIAEARKALKNDLFEVNSVIKASTPISTPVKKHPSAVDVTQSMQNLDIAKNQMAVAQMGNVKLLSPSEQITFERLSSLTTATLRILAKIYSLLVDMNFTINVLHEYSFLLNLLNVNIPGPTNSNKELQGTNSNDIETNSIEQNNGVDLLLEALNCVFFAVCVLEEQLCPLALIDIKSLGVVLQCERLVCLSPTLKTSLSAVYTQKQSSSIAAGQDISLGALKNVCFQEDSDSRKCFQSNNEFGAFKTQRDLFYGALKLWEKHHLYPSWNFTVEVSPKVREIFRQSENPINMTHFAKLFVSQLLISATEQTSPEEVGIGIDDVDLQKFNKLAQRLVAPSDFSVDYQFPREQAFFRDFIVESRSIAFLEHLKMVLFSELITLNDSTFEQLNLLAEDVYGECNEENEFIVRPPVLASMLILAKFLGFVMALPYQGSPSNEIPSSVVWSHQLRLRSLFKPPVNICHLLDTAIDNGRHLITLPWVVQYLAMLDEVTLRLDNFLETIQKLYDLYIALGSGELQITPTSAFIVRCCLGWFFDQKPEIGADYLNYRVTNDKTDNEKKNVIAKLPTVTPEHQTKPILDAILCVACPFLAEFRVSIMPAKYAMTKYVSRSGRFRHITPCIAEPTRSEEDIQLHQPPLAPIHINSLNNLSKIESPAKKGQKILMESFLHSQSSSMRRLIAFVTEHIYKCVVKDAQYKILLPSKTAADKQVNEITSSMRNIVLEQIQAIYHKARCEALQQWDTQIPKMLNDRLTRSLEDMLPAETTPIIKQAYAWRIRSDLKVKIEQWRQMNLLKNDFYCNDEYELAAKVCKVNATRTKKSDNQTTELQLVKSQPMISNLIEEMQHWLYTTSFPTSFQPELWDSNANDLQELKTRQLDKALIGFLERLKSSFENTLPTIYYRLIGASLIQLLQHLIITYPTHVTKDLINAVCEFCSNTNIRDADIATTPIKTINPLSSIEDLEGNELNSSNITSDMTTIYHALITAPFVESLGSCHIRYDKLKELLCALIESGVVTIEFINELILTLFKEDLDIHVFNAISKMLNEIVKKSNSFSCVQDDNIAADSDSDDGRKSQLLMEVLADFSRDLDDF